MDEVEVGLLEIKSNKDMQVFKSKYSISLNVKTLFIIHAVATHEGAVSQILTALSKGFIWRYLQLLNIWKHATT